MLRNSIILFFSIAAIYLGTFYALEWKRGSNGPWEVTYSVDKTGAPTVLVHNSKLKIDQLLIFTNTTVTMDSPIKLDYSQPSTNTPFGKIIYQDATFLPGVLTYQLFGHEIEFLPRTLAVDRKEVPWMRDAVVYLAQRPDSELPPPIKKKQSRAEEQPPANQ
ncbi:MAG: hypothetical protein JWM04_2175 [Verrucomicrobiales bacterium]|nr:hypothetical protein [Verrucomicrobiales bacterium]